MSLYHSCLVLYLIQFSLFTNGQQIEYKENERPFMVLKNQNLVLLVSVLSVIALLSVIMAVCVYKPLRRR